LDIITGDKNGGLIYSHFQNSPTVWNSLTKLGGGVENGLWENWNIDFLPGSVRKLR
jgi:hypothetical protein